MAKRTQEGMSMQGQQQHALRLVLIAGRDKPGATEAFVYLLNRAEPVLLLDMHSRRTGGRSATWSLRLPQWSRVRVKLR